MKWMRWLSAALAVMLLVAIVAITVGCGRQTASQEAGPDTSQYRSAVGWPSGTYRTFGGKKQVFPAGTTLQVESSATAQIDDGATFKLEGITISGPYLFGSSTSVVDGTTITHGLGTTPTMIMVTPRYTSDLTQTVFVSTTNATTFDIQIEAGGVTTLTEVYWMVGK